MDPAKRRRLLGWLFILGPTVSLVLFALGAWLVETSAGQALQSTVGRTFAAGPLGGGAWLMPNFTFAAIGWLLLTLGCAAGTCLRLFRQRGKTGGTLLVLVLLGTPLLAFAQGILALSVVFAGCLAIFGPIRS
jgi:hypothetical protein